MSYTNLIYLRHGAVQGSWRAIPGPNGIRESADMIVAELDIRFSAF